MKKHLHSALTFLSAAALLVAAQANAQTCPVPPGMDVLLFVDNSGSINNAEFDEAQKAVATIAADVLSHPGNRLAVVNWFCTGGSITTAANTCRIDLATGSAIPGGWSSNAADFSYSGLNSASNKVCRSFGDGDYAGSGGPQTDRCGNGAFITPISNDYAQEALKVLESKLYGGSITTANDGYGLPTANPSAPTQRLMLIHMTDATAVGNSLIKETPGGTDYFYSNRFKAPIASGGHNALVVGVGIDGASSGTAAQQLGALASKGGSGTFYDTGHASAPSTLPADVGSPRLTASSSTYNATTILSATAAVFAATSPACVILRKESTGGTGTFSFSGGTNGLSTASLDTATANPQSAPGVLLTNFNVDTSITETIPADWALKSVECEKAGTSTSVPITVTTDLATGLLTIPSSEVTAGAKLTCTFTNSLKTNLSITKTNTFGVNGNLDQSADTLISGSITTYTIVVSNSGASVTGAILKDPIASRTGLTCTAPPTCTGTACPAGPLTVASLDSGWTLGTLASGASVTVTLSCAVQ